MPSCWSCFKWTLLLCLIGGLVAVPYLYTRVDEEIRRAVEARLAAHYPQLAVHVRFAKLVEGEGIEIRGISILEPGATGAEAEVAYIDELFMACGTDLQALMTGVPEVKHLYIRRPRIRMTRRPNGTWSVAQLWPPPKLSERPADITIENGSLECADPSKQPAGLLTLRDLNLAVTHEHRPTSDPQVTEHIMHVEGALLGDHLRRIEVRGHLAPARGLWSFEGLVEALEFSPELVAALPSDVSEKLEPLEALRAQAKINFRLARTDEAPLEFAFTTQLSRGRIDDPRLPYPLNDLRATLHVDNRGLTIDELWARNGQTTLKLSCHRPGFAPDSPMTLVVDSSAMTLDQRLFETLPLALQSVWHKFFPKGEIDLSAHLTFDGHKWQAHELTAKCLNVSFLPYIKFPYRLERGSGTLRLVDNLLSIDLTAYSGASEVRIDGRVHNPGPEFTGEVTADAPNVHFDDNLFHALPESSRAVIRALNPSGTFNCFVRCGRTDPQQPLEREVLGRLNNCSIQYDKFPYPLSNIRGNFLMKDAQWIFSNLEGTNDTGIVKCKGHFKPLAEGSELLLRFTAENLPLEEELRDALLLNPRAQHLWTTLRPRGQVDMTYCQVLYHSGQGKPSVEFRIEPRGDTASIEPVPFPYRLEKLQGSIFFRDGQIEIERLRAEHARTRLSTTGSCTCTPEGNWQLAFNELTIDQLQADRDLVTALPGRLKKVVTALSPTGPINLRGVFNLFGSMTPGAPLQASWDLELVFNQIGIVAGIRLDNLAGALRLIGNFDGQTTKAWGNLSFDSLIYKDWQFTDVAGPIWIDDERVLLGRDAGLRQPGQAPRSITANWCGGGVLGDCWIRLGDTPRYSLAAELRGADLTRFTQEALPGRQQLSGKVFGRLELSGQPQGLHTLRGGGSVQLRDADIYRLPLMVALLKILSVRPPDNTAFTESDIDFRIQGSHIYFTRMNFNGDAISLRGDGEMYFDKQIRLNFHAAVGRRELQIPLVRELVKGASQQFMQIRVEGTVDAPITTAEAFPGVNQAFKDLEAGLQGEAIRPRP